MKKINRLTLVLTLMAAGLFAGCASDEEATRENQKIALDGSHFKFTEVAYQADQAVTRAAASVKPTTVDLGDGLEAEVSVTPDAPTGKTRAVDPISDGKYTILAFDPTTHDLQGRLEGSVTSGVFTPDAGQKLLLDPGTYDFTCFSEPVVYDEPNNRLVINRFLTKNPMIGHVQATIADDDYEVAFNMEHKAIRVRFNITSDILSENTPIDAYLRGVVFGPWYWWRDWYTAYSGVLNNTGNYDYAADAPLNFKTVAPVTTQAGTTYTSDYVYMLPGRSSYDYISNYTLHFTAGTIGGGSLASKTINLSGATFPTGFQWDYNQSITINVNVKGQLYLFEDGKARVYAGRGTHTPIGVVLQQKWEPTNQKGTAVALKEATVSGNNEFTYSTPYGSSSMFATTNSTTYADINDGQHDVNGYKWTWDAASNPHDHVVKADKYQDYTPYYAAGHYAPSVAVTGANVGRWYLPALGDWALLFKVLDEWNPTPNAVYPQQGTFPWNKAKVNAVFTKAGGKGLFDFGSPGFTGYNVYWTSTEYSQTMMFPYLYYNGGNTINIMSNGKHNITGKVRPFVHF